MVSNGVIVQPDLSLSEALPLASKVRSLILTFDWLTLLHELNDPRLATLLQIACANAALLVAPQPMQVTIANDISVMVGRDISQLVWVCQPMIETDESMSELVYLHLQNHKT